MNSQPNILCISTFFKGEPFIKSCKDSGANVFLLTKRSLQHEAWPWESIDEVFYIDDWNTEHVKQGIAWQFNQRKFDLFIALDDFDVEHVAALREHFRIDGMGVTTAQYFRDKLAMRMKAKSAGISVPEFSSLFHDADINAFADSVVPPWLVKPRSEASATGIKKINNKHELWQHIHSLGEHRDHYLVEKFAPGDVYHIDGLNHNGEVIFSRASQYLDTPFEVAHGGGIFRSHTLEAGSAEEEELLEFNKKVMQAFGMKHGACHTEIIKSKEDGQLFFLETASRVGGAHLAEMVQMASGINLWYEWAKIEIAVLQNQPYFIPEVKQSNAGIVVSLSRYERPDTSSFSDREIIWRMNKPWHIGLIVASNSREKILELLDGYTHRIWNEFHASAPI